MGCGSEASLILVGVSWKASLWRFGNSFGSLWGASWGLFWASWELLGASEVPPGRLLAVSGVLQGRRARNVTASSPSWASLGVVLGLSRAVLKASAAVLELSWAVLGLSWGCLGRLVDRLGAILEVSQALLG